MKNSNAVLAKHHFWILAGSFAVLLFVGFLLMWIIGGGAAVAKEKERNDLLGKVNAAQPKGTAAVSSLDDQNTRLETKTGLFWKENYDRQKEKHVFDWPLGDPRSPDQNLVRFEKADYAFGTNFPTPSSELVPIALKKAFDLSYKSLPDIVSPTRFPGTYPSSALRMVGDWGPRNLSTEHLWLAIEDFWVQKALLKAIAEVNANAAVFTDVTPKVDETAQKWTLRNRTWDLNLWVETIGSDRYLRGKLTNRTDRLQVLGARKEMVVKLWFDDPTKGKPVEDVTKLVEGARPYRIEGETVPGGGSMEVKLDKVAHKVTDLTTDTLHLAVQVQDEATVPVRMVQRIELGAKDNRRVAAPLASLNLWGPDEPPADTTTTGTGGPLSSGTGSGASGSGSQPTAAGTADAVLLGNRKRYLESTKEVRRMPVGLSVVIDTDYQNDLLIALANSPLRVQVTQSQWQRFRGDLGLLPPASSSGAAGGTPPSDLGSSGGPASSGTGAPGSLKPSVGTGSPAVGTGTGGPASSGTPPATGSGTASSGSTNYSTISGSGGLVEMAVYGVVSLYEKYQPPAVDATKTVGDDPTKTDPTKTDPMPTTTDKPVPPQGTATPAVSPAVTPSTTPAATTPSTTPPTTPATTPPPGTPPTGK